MEIPLGILTSLIGALTVHCIDDLSEYAGERMSKVLLSFEKIAFAYDANGKTVLNELSLEVEENTVTAILGPNGVGKTTLLHLALGWRLPQHGRVLLDGRPLDSYSRRELGQWIGLVPQHEHVSFDYSLLEYVLLGRAPYLKAALHADPQG